MATTTDSFNSTATKHGLANSSSSSGGTVARFDDFSVRAVWDLSLATGGSGNCLGNSGITFTTSSTQTATGTASFTWSTHGWTSRVPLPQDDVVISNAFSASQTITADMPRLGRSIDFTGATGTPAWSLSNAVTMYGSLTLIIAMTFTGAFSFSFGGRSAGLTLTSNTRTFPNRVNQIAPGGTYTLQDHLTLGSGGGSTAILDIRYGTFDAATFNVACDEFRCNTASATRTVNLGSGTWSLRGGGIGTWWNLGNTTGLTINPGTATIQFTWPDGSGSTKTFTGAGFSYPTVKSVLGSFTLGYEK